MPLFALCGGIKSGEKTVSWGVMKTFGLIALVVVSAATGACAGGSYFPKFADFAGKPYSVAYTPRAVTLDGQASLFLSGSIHPPRLSVEEWDTVMADMVASGLNMLEV